MRTPAAAAALRYALWAGQGAGAALLLLHYVGEVTLTTGPSMLPTLNVAGDWIVAERLSWRWRRSLAVGDLVLAVSPRNPAMIVCKRVLGMPGDHVCKDPTAAAPAWVTVPAGHVWLAGDNLTNSRDSRNYGPVAMGLIRGHIVCKIWPQFERLHNNSVPATHLDLERL